MINQKVNNLGLGVSKIKLVRLAVLVTGALVLTSCFVFADVMTAGKGIIDDVKAKFFAASTAAALVGIATGAFLKKFSLGKGDRIETGNKIMVNSIWGFVILQGGAGILTYIQDMMNK